VNERVNRVLGGYSGTVLAIKKNNVADKVHYDLDKPVAILESFYVCNNDPAGIELCLSISNAIDSLLKKGMLDLNVETGFSRFNPHKLK
jgi:hypothetical protein